MNEQRWKDLLFLQRLNEALLLGTSKEPFKPLVHETWSNELRAVVQRLYADELPSLWEVEFLTLKQDNEKLKAENEKLKAAYSRLVERLNFVRDLVDARHPGARHSLYDVTEAQLGETKDDDW
jgi:hypothetical protein